MYGMACPQHDEMRNTLNYQMAELKRAWYALLDELLKAVGDPLVRLSGWLASWRSCSCCDDRGKVKEVSGGVLLCDFCDNGRCESCHWYKPGHGGHRGR